ncbi:PilN domain-containing protein [Ornithinibacillus salinisoli]|uniref:PilN domain-containing protein n=1 Tax=Ornithinibacillus salinisoli TaxID=1848459 RepID=A0ABW4W5C1_9BACI
MLPEVNLLPKIERQSSALYILFISGLLIFLILLAAITFLYFHVNNNLEDTNQNIENLNQERQLLEARLSSTGTDETIDLFENVLAYAQHHVTPTSNFINELMVLLPENSYLSNYNYSVESVEFEVQFETMDDIADYVTKLTESDYVTDVKVNQLNAIEVPVKQDKEDGEDNEITTSFYTVSYSIIVNDKYLKEEVDGDE